MDSVSAAATPQPISAHAPQVQAINTKDARRLAFDGCQPPGRFRGFSLFRVSARPSHLYNGKRPDSADRKTTGILVQALPHDAIYDSIAVDVGVDSPTPCGAQACSLDTTSARLNAVKTPPKKTAGPARQGATKAKQLERLQSTRLVLDPEEATCFRALSARTNYLSQDRPDIAFAAKELCREFVSAHSQELREAQTPRPVPCGTPTIGLPVQIFRTCRARFPADPGSLYAPCLFASRFVASSPAGRAAFGGAAFGGGHRLRRWRIALRATHCG